MVAADAAKTEVGLGGREAIYRSPFAPRYWWHCPFCMFAVEIRSPNIVLLPGDLWANGSRRRVDTKVWIQDPVLGSPPCGTERRSADSLVHRGCIKGRQDRRRLMAASRVAREGGYTALMTADRNCPRPKLSRPSTCHSMHMGGQANIHRNRLIIGSRGGKICSIPQPTTATQWPSELPAARARSDWRSGHAI